MMGLMDPVKPEIVSEDKQIEHLLANAFGGSPLRFRVVHNTRKYEVDVLAMPGKPEAELCCLGTIGLWRTNLQGPKTSESQRVELVSIFEASREGAREVLAVAAFKVMRTQRKLSAGTVFVNCLHDWYPQATIRHLYFVDANLWSFPQLVPATMGSLQICFVEALPITESEYQYVQERGGEALEANLLGASANLWDLKQNACL